MFAGLIRTLLYIVGVWFIWRWLDRIVGRGAPSRFSQTSSRSSAYRGPRASHNPQRPDDSKEGEYVDFEELND
ncbi:MAG: hypothetical protein RLZZ314_1792 [Bacteroidota bacterium]|jgi:hypothetical protein|nr:hypothetical protein [Bacteroidota bacterium]